jgi:hypothetical protein
MSKPPRNKVSLPLDDPFFAVKRRKVVPHEFVFDAIAPLSPETRSMFGCLAVYVADKIVLILRDKREPSKTADNGCGSLPPRSTMRVCVTSSRTCDPFEYSGSK